MGISGGGDDLKYSVIDGEDGNIKCTTTKIEDENIFFTLFLLIKTVGYGCGCWLIENSDYVKTRDGTSILGSLSLGVIEIGWYSNNSVDNLFT